jgi:hypothetical protein
VPARQNLVNIRGRPAQYWRAIAQDKPAETGAKRPFSLADTGAGKTSGKRCMSIRLDLFGRVRNLRHPK